MILEEVYWAINLPVLCMVQCPLQIVGRVYFGVLIADMCLEGYGKVIADLWYIYEFNNVNSFFNILKILDDFLRTPCYNF